MTGLAERGLEAILRKLRDYAHREYYDAKEEKQRFWKGYEKALDDVEKEARE